MRVHTEYSPRRTSMGHCCTTSSTRSEMDVVKSGLEIFALLLVVIISSALYERPQDGRRFQGQGSAHIQRQRQTAPWSLNCTSGTTNIIVPSCVYESSTYALHPDFRLGVILLKLLRDVLAHIAVALLPMQSDTREHRNHASTLIALAVSSICAGGTFSSRSRRIFKTN